MPLRQEFSPQVSFAWENASTVQLEIAAARTPHVRERLRCVVIGPDRDLLPLASVADHSAHEVALVSETGQLLRTFGGGTEAAWQAAPDLPRALTLARTLLETSRGGAAQRIVLLAHGALPHRLEVEWLAAQLPSQGIALDVITPTTAEPVWQALTGQSCGRVWQDQGSRVLTFSEYLASWRRVTLEGVQVQLCGLVGIGEAWQAGKVTLPPLFAGDTHRLRLRRPAQILENPRVQVRVLGVGYTVTCPLTPLPDARVA